MAGFGTKFKNGFEPPCAMALSQQAEVAVPNKLHELAEKFIQQAKILLRPSKNNPSGSLELQVAVRPYIFIATKNLAGLKWGQLIYFCGSLGDESVRVYSVGVWKEETGIGCIVNVHYDTSSMQVSSIIPPLKAEYERLLGMPMPDSRPLEGHNSGSDEIFRNVPGSLERLAEVAFSTITEYTLPIRMHLG